MRYKATANLSWAIDTDDADPTEFAKKQLEEMLQSGEIEIHSSVKVDKMRKQKHRQTVGVFSPEEILSRISDASDRQEFVIDGKTYSVRMNSHRYFVFRTSLDCVACGLTGTKMLLEKHPRDMHPHFNLYGEENGQLVLMTKDHILAKSYGGEDRHSNYQTMCSICNNLKGSSKLTIEGIQELRRVYNENVLHASRKKLCQMLDTARKELVTSGLLMPHKDRGTMSKHEWHCLHVGKKSKEKTVILKCDIHIVEQDGKLIGTSIYDIKEGATVLACVQAGTFLTPLGSRDRKLIFAFGDDREYSLYHGHTDYAEA